MYIFGADQKKYDQEKINLQIPTCVDNYSTNVIL